MSHRSGIACDGCKMPLGEFIGSGLRLFACGPVLLGPSSAGIECPRCRRPRIWAYTQQTSGMTSLMHG